MTALTVDRRALLRRRVRLIVAATIGYNLVEAAVALSAGAAASSTALVGFGLDSGVEVLSAAAVAWQFTRRDPERWERGTLRVVAVAFFALAASVGVSSVLALTGGREAEHSTVGLVLTALSLLVMPGLSLAERRVGVELDSPAVVADSKQTLVCAALSAAILLGLVLDSALGWWWADPVAGLVIVAFALREGAEAWRGDACATSVGLVLEDEEHAGH
ncbi:cation transporter [Rathayibacter sp. VKM Ac-2760]|uniref:cation transporter n=1 Tax=Rathayibacter sp. VKM Ac-2760 TaxID=2609253 RepID=UPI001317C793|nr:cation transporter [Rathayibacter sp. VKM Ac-2760]QHC57608.1 cation transporter [Rathayibacter sp. VKM Ac-2760]